MLDVRTLLPENARPFVVAAADEGHLAVVRFAVFDGDDGDIDAMPRTVAEVSLHREPEYRGGRLLVHASWPESFGPVAGRGVPFVNRVMGRSGLALDETPMTPDEAQAFVAALVRKVHARLR
jgi:hypothetical protein